MHFLKHELVAATVAFSLCVCGCVKNHITVPAPVPNPPAQLGATVYPSLQIQEENGEASDFVVYEHEFVQGTSRLNPEGESHLRQIAVRAPHTPFPVIVEHVSPDVSTDDPCYVACTTLDAQRRQAVTAALTMMGVPGAHGRVISGPALTAGLTAGEADSAYNAATTRGSNGGGNGNGNGNGGGRGGGFGGGGGGGGGGFF